MNPICLLECTFQRFYNDLNLNKVEDSESLEVSCIVVLFHYSSPTQKSVAGIQIDRYFDVVAFNIESYHYVPVEKRNRMYEVDLAIHLPLIKQNAPI